MRRALLVLLGAAALSCERAAPSPEHALAGHRPYLLRLSFQDSYAPCAVEAAETSAGIGPIACAPAGARRARRIAARSSALREHARSSGDSSAMLARLDLLGGASGAAAERAIRRLERERRRDSSAAVLNDLGVAYAVRAAETDSPLDLLRALDAVLRAVERDGAFEPALFNRSLLLDRLALAGEAEAAWDAFTVVAGDRDWSRERPVRAPPTTRDLQQLREDSARVALAGWAHATLAADAARASAAVADARRIGGELIDGTVADAVAVIASADEPAQHRLAEGLTAYGRAERAFVRGDFVGSDADLARAESLLRGSGSPYFLWNELGRAAVLLYKGNHAAADSLSMHVRRQFDAARYPALAGRVLWIRALAAARLGAYEPAIALYTDGMQEYRRARELESIGALEFQIGGSLMQLGQARTGERRMITALHIMAPYRSSPRLHDGLLAFGRHATSLGLYHVARAVHLEGLHVAGSTGRVKDPAEVRVRLAQNAIAAGRVSEAEQHFDAARALYAAVTDTLMLRRGEADLHDTESALVLQSRPQHAVELLTASVDYFTGMRNAPGSIRALTRRGAALRAEDRQAEAAADLQRAIALYEQNLTGATGGTRAALQESAAAAYDAMIAVQLELDRPVEALSWLMRSRGTSVDAVAASAARERARVLAYAMLPDELVVWVLEKGAWRAVRQPVGARELDVLVAGFIGTLQSGDLPGEDAVLHRLLLPLPLDDPNARLLVVPDRVLGSLPFAALRDSAGTYLGERALVSIYSPGRFASPAPRGTPRVLVAGAARFDAASFGDLPPLPAAQQEAQRVSAMYPGATLLQDQQVAPDRLLAELATHDMLHFAGHARALPATPDQSFLVTAADARGVNRVTASQIAQRDLRHLSLVVLGACSSAERGGGRSGEVNGLAQAFLSAGARAVVASVWDVDDTATGELLTRMHRHIAAGSAPVEALRAAQLELLRSGDPRLSGASAWAGFQHYTS